MSNALKNFEKLYQNFDLTNKDLFYSVYDEKVVFKDPFHEIHGADDLYDYFVKLMKNVKECDFDIKHIAHTDETNAFVVWDMVLTHPHLNKGSSFNVSGATHLRLEDKVVLHRDYFDGHDLIYKHIPVLGFLINTVKRNV